MNFDFTTDTRRTDLGTFVIFLLLMFVSTTIIRSAELTILSSNAAPPTVGLEGKIELLLPPDLKPIAADNKSPLLLRIASTRPHGSMVHYDLRYIGRIPGAHDLRDYLQTQENNPATNLPSITVEVIGILSDQHNGWLEDQTLHSPSVFGGYRGIVGTIVVVWALLFFPLFFLGRKKHEDVIEETVADATLADRMKPLVERAAAGSITDDDKAALERMLITYWQHELDLDEVYGEHLIPKIREHEEAGKLLRALEDWLHRRPGTVQVNVDELLAPYRNPPRRAEVPK